MPPFPCNSQPAHIRPCPQQTAAGSFPAFPSRRLTEVPWHSCLLYLRFRTSRHYSPTRVAPETKTWQFFELYTQQGCHFHRGSTQNPPKRTRKGVVMLLCWCATGSPGAILSCERVLNKARLLISKRLPVAAQALDLANIKPGESHWL
jgi:hypothetical protein